MGEVESLVILLGKVEKRPHEGVGWSEGWKGGTGIPPKGGNRGNPGIGLKRWKGATGMPRDRGAAEETPGRGWEGGRGITGTPTYWEGAEVTPQMDRVQGRVTNRDPPIGEGAEGIPFRVRVLQEVMSVTFHGGGCRKDPRKVQLALTCWKRRGRQ